MNKATILSGLDTKVEIAKHIQKISVDSVSVLSPLSVFVGIVVLGVLVHRRSTVGPTSVVRRCYVDDWMLK